MQWRPWAAICIAGLLAWPVLAQEPALPEVPNTVPAQTWSLETPPPLQPCDETQNRAGNAYGRIEAGVLGQSIADQLRLSPYASLDAQLPFLRKSPTRSLDPYLNLGGQVVSHKYGDDWGISAQGRAEAVIPLPLRKSGLELRGGGTVDLQKFGDELDTTINGKLELRWRLNLP